MNRRNLQLPDILANVSAEQREQDLKIYALEHFATEVDLNIQNDLLRHLVLEHATIAKQNEILYQELSRSEEMLIEAQKIAMLGRWDIYHETGEARWSRSIYDLIEADAALPASAELLLSRVHPDDLAHVTDRYHLLFSIKEPWAMEYRLKMKDGRIKWVYLTCNPIIENSGQVLHCYGTIQDITETKKVEEKLEKYSKHLEKLVEEKVQEISSSQMATIFALIRLSESRDDDTGTHIERTASFCRLLAEKSRDCSKYASEIDENFIETIYKASPLHDIGKVGIPDRILLKPGKLTADEFEIMKTHVNIGHQTLEEVRARYDHNAFLKMGMEISLYHHEKWDGCGYSTGLLAEEIPLSARIMAISDVYDALRSKRVYKEAFSHEKSLEMILAGKGNHFDPVLVDVFLQAEEEFRRLYESIK